MVFDLSCDLDKFLTWSYASDRDIHKQRDSCPALWNALQSTSFPPFAEVVQTYPLWNLP